MIAFCGLNCAKCDGYLATQTNDPQVIQETAEKWSKMHGSTILPEHVICDGCKEEKRHSFYCGTTCEIRKCCIAKELNSCADCDEFACEKVSFIVDNVPDARENLMSIKLN